MNRRFAFLLPVFFLLLSACAGVGQESWLISEETEIELGAEYHLQLLEEMPAYEGDPAVTAYVTAMGQRIALESDRPDLVYHFTVLATDEVNAFAVPGGYLYVTIGLLRTAASGAELAGVLAHELGHISARHGVQAMETYVLAEGLADLLGDEDLGPLVSGAIQVGTGLTFSKDQEREADQLGVAYAMASGYNPWGIVRFFEALQGLEGPAPDPDDPVGSILSDMGELFSTHPPTAERIDSVKAQIEGAGVSETSGGYRWEDETALAEIQGILESWTPPEEAPEEVPAE